MLVIRGPYHREGGLYSGFYGMLDIPRCLRALKFHEHEQ